MKTRPSSFLFWFALGVCIACVLISWRQIHGPAPTQNWQWVDLLTLRGWIEPIGFIHQAEPTANELRAGPEGAYALWPSPLVLLTHLLMWIILARATMQEARYHKTKQPRLGGIHDAPVENLQSDRLDRAPLVRAMADLFRNMNTRPPLTVTLNAPWGVGKSSVLQMLQTELQGHARCVYLNPWHYPQDSQLLAALMTGICKHAVPPMLSLANLLFRFNLFFERIVKPHWRWLLVLISVLALALAPASNTFAQLTHDLFKDAQWQAMLQSLAQTSAKAQAQLPPTWQAWLGAWTGHGGQLISLLLFLLLGRPVVKRLYTFSPSLTHALSQSAQWAAKSVSLPDWSQHAGLRQQFSKDFTDITQALGTERLVLLIDDLDRCEPHQVAQNLATLNFITSNQAPCFVVLAMDKVYVQHALGLAYKDMAQAMREDKASLPSANTHTATNSNNEADRLQFASHYLRKMVQLEISLTHNHDQGALLVLDGLPTHVSPSETDSTAPVEQPPPLHGCARYIALWQQLNTTCFWGRVKACVLHCGQGLKLCFQTVVAVCARALLTKALWAQVKSKLWAFVQVLLSTLCWACLNISALLRWLGRWLKRGFMAILDAPYRCWQTFGNGILVAVSSYLIAVMLATMAVMVLPGWVPQADPESTVKTGTQPDPAKAEAKVSKSLPQNQTQAVNLAQNGWLLTNILAVVVMIIWIAIRTAQTVRDSEGFVMAVRHWNPVLSPRFSNPREWKRLTNMARFLAMRVRADAYQTPSKRLAKWWKAQLQELQVDLKNAIGCAPVEPTDFEKPTPFSLSEGAAVELWMLDCLSNTRVRAALPQFLKLETPPVPDLATFFAYCYNGNVHQMYDPKQSASPQNQGKVKTYLQKDQTPNLKPLYEAWESDRTGAVKALHQWLHWTQDLKMDLPEA
jgi:KAP family P-loop domain